MKTLHRVELLLILFAVTIASAEKSGNLIRLVRRAERQFVGLPTTAARSLGALTSSSPWRISYNSVHGNSSPKNSTAGWTAVVRRRLATSTIATTFSPPAASSGESSKFVPIRPSFPKKNLIPRFAVSTTLKRRITTTTTTESPTTPTSTTVATTTVASERPQIREDHKKHQPHIFIGKTKHYVEIRRRVKKPKVAQPEIDEAEEGEGDESAAGPISSNPNEYTVQIPFLGDVSGRAIRGPVPKTTANGIDPYNPTTAGVDPYHPSIKRMGFHAPHNPLEHNYEEPPLRQHERHPPKRHGHHHDTALLPMDKTLVYVSMIFTWIFWIVAFTTYYHLWGPGNHTLKMETGLNRRTNAATGEDANKPGAGNSGGTTMVNNGGGPLLIQQSRSLDSGSSAGWNVNWGQVLYMISLAQESYEKFDFQSLDCQKKTLCELSQKQGGDFGETGRKISNTFSVMDVLDGLPMPSIIQTYLKEYREAINNGKSSTKDCSAFYPKCAFSVKEVFVKYQKKAAAGKF